MKIQKIALGYWYQRTSLHLAEMNDFLLGIGSPLDLDAHKLHELRTNLHIESVRTDVDVLERLEVKFGGSLSSRIYEDGLVLVMKEYEELESDIKDLNDFFQNNFLPAVKYLFSLGAPVPRELAGVNTPTPIFIVAQNASAEEAKDLISKFHPASAEMDQKTIQVFKGGNYYLINVLGDFDKEEHLIESLIFFKEFKAQLHHYLNLHRVLWEKIEAIKEKGSIRGKDVSKMRSELESYKKTVELIAGRIEQMDLYIPTRASIVSDNDWAKLLTGILKFQYDNLDHNLEYIKSLWKMTLAYLDSAIQIFSDVSALSTRDSVNALTIISSIGVISGILNFLVIDKFPHLTKIGISYFVILLLTAIVINRLLRFVYKHVKYKLNDVKLAKLTSERRL